MGILRTEWGNAKKKAESLKLVKFDLKLGDDLDKISDAMKSKDLAKAKAAAEAALNKVNQYYKKTKDENGKYKSPDPKYEATSQAAVHLYNLKNNVLLKLKDAKALPDIKT